MHIIYALYYIQNCEIEKVFRFSFSNNCRSHPQEEKASAAMVGWVNLLQPLSSLKSDIEKLTAAPGGRKIVAFRHVAEAEPDADWLAQTAVLENVKEIGNMGYAIDLLIRTRNIPAAIKLVQYCPGVSKGFICSI